MIVKPKLKSFVQEARSFGFGRLYAFCFVGMASISVTIQR